MVQKERGRYLIPGKTCREKNCLALILYTFVTDKHMLQAVSCAKHLARLFKDPLLYVSFARYTHGLLNIKTNFYST